MEINEIDYQGLNALEMQDEAIRLIILPEWGGKIVSLYDKSHNREWLYINTNFNFQRLPTYDSNYIRDFDIGGFDECFPNIGAGLYPAWPWRGVVMPDHGEVWALPWEVVQNNSGMTLSVEGVRLPYKLEKRIELHSDGLWMYYSAMNRTRFDMPMLWSSHPLLDVRKGMYLEVPTDSIRIDSCNPLFSDLFGVKPGEIISWPQYREKDFSIILGAEAQISAKMVARKLSAGNVSLIDSQKGRSLTFHFDPNVVTHCGIWLNYCGWAGKPGAEPYYNIGFEPCIGVADRLDVALDLGEAGLLAARDKFTWYLHISLD